MQSLGDRIKSYEKVSRDFLLSKTPVMIRVDGKAFHTFTKNAEKPFDSKLISAMSNAALEVAKRMQGFRVGYVQSDEATFLTVDDDTINSQGWFNYNKNKLVSISASTMTAYFNQFYGTEGELALFDSRAFNVPVSDIANAFLWRAQDWERNSLQMLARAHFSHKELHKKNKVALHELLHSKGINWAKLSDVEKNGTWIINHKEKGIQVIHDILPNYGDINEVISESLSSFKE